MGLMKVFSGSEILALALQEKLETAGIDTVKKDNMTIRNLYLLLYCLIFEPESKSTCYEFA